MPDKRQIAFCITKEQHKRLKHLSKKNKMPMSVYMRKGIYLVLKLHEEDSPRMDPERERIHDGTVTDMREW